MFGALAGFVLWLLLFAAFYTTASAYIGAWFPLEGESLAIAVGTFWLFVILGMGMEADQ